MILSCLLAWYIQDPVVQMIQDAVQFDLNPACDGVYAYIDIHIRCSPLVHQFAVTEPTFVDRPISLVIGKSSFFIWIRYHGVSTFQEDRLKRCSSYGTVISMHLASEGI